MAGPPPASPMSQTIPRFSLARLALVAVGVGLPAAAAQQGPAPEAGASHIGPHLQTLHGLEGPVACAYGPGGELFVVEQHADRVHRFAADGRDLGTFGTGLLLAPAGVVAGPGGRIFVSDAGGARIVRLGLEEGSAELTFGEKQLHQPRGLALAGERLAVADAGFGRVALFDRDGAFQGALGEGHLKRPVDVAFRPNGGVAVLDGESVVLLRADGSLEGSFGAWGAFPGLLSSPSGLAAFGDRLFVCDTENHRVQVFDPKGELQYAWGLHAIRPREGKGKLHYPAHIALNPAGDRAALPEPLDGRVQIFARAPGAQPEVDPLRALGGKPSAHYGFDWEVSGDLMAAVEPESRRVLVYDLRLLPGDNPVQITELGGYGSSLGLFLRPTGLWFDGPARHLIVCDGDRGTLTEVRLDLEPEAELAWDPFLPRIVRSIHLDGVAGDAMPRPFPITPRDVARHSDGRFFVLCERNNEVLVLGPDLQALGIIDGSAEPDDPFLRPVQIQLTPDGLSLFVVDELAGCARRFDARPDQLGKLQERIDAGGALVRPYGLAQGPKNSLYLSDAATSLVHVRDAGGEWTSFGGPGIRHNELLSPRAMGFDRAERLYVMDHGNHRGMVLDAEGEFAFAFGPRLYTKPARLPHTYKPEDYVE